MTRGAAGWYDWGMSTATLPSLPTVPLAPAPSWASGSARYGMSSLPVRRFSVAEYHRMIELGFFARDERCELLEGWIVRQVSKNPPHESHVALGRRMLDRRLPPGWHVRVQSAITTPESEPEPDLAVVRGEEMEYKARHPEAADIAIVVEISSTTLKDDRTLMGRIYARACLSTYWIINLVDQQVEVYEQPSGPVQEPSFGHHRVFRRGEAVPFIVDGNDVGPIPVTDLLP